MSGIEEGRAMQLHERSSGTAESVQQQASEMKDQALDKGGEVVRSQVDQRSTQLGHEAKKLARALRRSGEDLRAQNGEAAVARLTTQAADRLERAGSYLQQARGEDLVRDAERFARRMPWLVAGAAAAVGFAASRFLKASAESRYPVPEHERGYDSWQRRVDDPISSERYPSPPAVAVGPAGSAPGQ